MKFSLVAGLFFSLIANALADGTGYHPAYCTATLVCDGDREQVEMQCGNIFRSQNESFTYLPYKEDPKDLLLYNNRYVKTSPEVMVVSYKRNCQQLFVLLTTAPECANKCNEHSYDCIELPSTDGSYMSKNPNTF